MKFMPIREPRRFKELPIGAMFTWSRCVVNTNGVDRYTGYDDLGFPGPHTKLNGRRYQDVHTHQQYMVGSINVWVHELVEVQG